MQIVHVLGTTQVVQDSALITILQWNPKTETEVRLPNLRICLSYGVIDTKIKKTVQTLQFAWTENIAIVWAICTIYPYNLANCIYLP